MVANLGSGDGRLDLVGIGAVQGLVPHQHGLPERPALGDADLHARDRIAIRIGHAASDDRARHILIGLQLLTVEVSYAHAGALVNGVIRGEIVIDIVPGIRARPEGPPAEIQVIVPTSVHTAIAVAHNGVAIGCPWWSVERKAADGHQNGTMSIQGGACLLESQTTRRARKQEVVGHRSSREVGARLARVGVVIAHASRHACVIKQCTDGLDVLVRDFLITRVVLGDTGAVDHQVPVVGAALPVTTAHPSSICLGFTHDVFLAANTYGVGLVADANLRPAEEVDGLGSRSGHAARDRVAGVTRLVPGNRASLADIRGIVVVNWP